MKSPNINLEFNEKQIKFLEIIDENVVGYNGGFKHINFKEILDNLPETLISALL